MSFRRVNGQALRAIREAVGVRVSDLARRAEISTGFLSNIEAGRRQPTDVVTAALAHSLGVSVDAITYPVAEPHDEVRPVRAVRAVDRVPA